MQRKKIEVLLSHGANHCAKDKVSLVVLVSCVSPAVVDLFHLLFSQDGNTPLHLAALRCDCEAVSVLLRSGRRCINIVNKVSCAA